MEQVNQRADGSAKFMTPICVGVFSSFFFKTRTKCMVLWEKTRKPNVIGFLIHTQCMTLGSHREASAGGGGQAGRPGRRWAGHRDPGRSEGRASGRSGPRDVGTLGRRMAMWAMDAGFEAPEKKQRVYWNCQYLVGVEGLR